MHFALGAGLGAAANLKNPRSGAWGGGIAAVAAEITAGALPTSRDSDTILNISRMVGVFAAFAAKGDVNSGIFAATNAVENNYLSQYNFGQLAKESSENEFVETLLDEWAENKGPIDPQERERLRGDLQKRYHVLRLIDFSRSFTAPGQEDLDHKLSLSYDEFRREEFAALDPKIFSTAAGRLKAEDYVKARFDYYRGKGFDLNIAPLFGLAGGVATVGRFRQAPRSVQMGEHLPQSANIVEALDLTNGRGQSRVGLINNRKPINSVYANSVYPLEKLPESLRQRYPHSVPFTGTGHPDFSRYAVKKVRINVSGKNHIDFPAADNAAGLIKRPKGFTWHHHHDGKSMYLVPQGLHDAVRHTGGVAIIKKRGK